MTGLLLPLSWRGIIHRERTTHGYAGAVPDLRTDNAGTANQCGRDKKDIKLATASVDDGEVTILFATAGTQKQTRTLN